MKCHKQPSSSILCGYYICEFMRINRRYIGSNVRNEPVSYCAQHFYISVWVFTWISVLQLKKIHNQDHPLEEKDIYNVIRDLCRFIHREVCHKGGKYFESDGIRVNEPDMASVFDWTRHQSIIWCVFAWVKE